MDSKTAYLQLKETLTKAGVEDAGFEAGCLMTHVTGQNRFELDDLTDEAWAELQKLAARRAAREPLQYILGSWPFLSLELKVGPGVLVPRPETEELCLAAAGLVETVFMPSVADLCSGSGALALGLQSLLPDAMVVAVEKEEDAYGYLLENIGAFAQTHDEAPIAVRDDVLAWYGQVPDDTYDLVVCNPPYVTEAEYAALAPEVHAEPKTALVPRGGEGDGLLFYRVIGQRYLPKLRRGGHLAFEIGAGQGEAVSALLARQGYAEVRLRRDAAGRDRMVFAQRP